MVVGAMCAVVRALLLCVRMCNCNCVVRVTVCILCELQCVCL